MVSGALEPAGLLRGVATVFELATPWWIRATDPKGMAREVVGLVTKPVDVAETSTNPG